MKTLRLREPSLASAVNDFAAKIRIFRGQIIKALAPARVREPLMEAPIFSEDTNIFPSDVLTSVNTLATTLDDKLVLPKEGTKRYPMKSAYQKRPFQSQDRAAEPQSKRIRNEASAPRLTTPPQRYPRLQYHKNAQQSFRSNKARLPIQNKGRKQNKAGKQHFPTRRNAWKIAAPMRRPPNHNDHPGGGSPKSFSLSLEVILGFEMDSRASKSELPTVLAGIPSEPLHSQSR